MWFTFVSSFIFCFSYIIGTTEATGDVCNLACPRIYKPACASNRRTYNNICNMAAYICSSGTALTVLHSGRCPRPSQVVLNAVRTTEDPNSECHRPCPLSPRPLCASNGISYPNSCSYEVAKCQIGDSLRIVHAGRCSTPPTCDRICTANYQPLCASDGVTYANRCTFEVAKCESSSLTVVFSGRCPETSPPVLGPEPDSCERGCTFDYRPECGSDGITYPNHCAFEIANCKVGYSLTVVYNGTCEVASPTSPTSSATTSIAQTQTTTTTTTDESCLRPCARLFMPECGSDGRTYNNHCAFLIARCKGELLGEQLTVEYIGRCRTPPRNRCSRPCNRNYDPVCASDGNSYSNPCMFEIAKCTARGNLSVIRLGRCPANS